MINAQFALVGEPITAQTIVEGESQFIVTFSLSPDSALLSRSLMDYLY
ncbi:hypothetical protein AB4262_18735 [Vibrio breoganii]|nr:hypothetical protein [Vibrio breoganii]